MLRLATLFIAIVAVKEIATEWSAWNDWSECSVECGTGYQSRTRRCPSPSTHFMTYGDDCPGSFVDYKGCNWNPCTGLEDAGLEDGEYKMFNKRWGGPLFGGSSKDSANDHWAWVGERKNYEDNGKERVYLKKQLDGTYKIFSKKWKGPLFCGSGTDKDGDHWAWFNESPSYESNGKERWTIEQQPDGYYKLFNKKCNGPLFCGGRTDSSGDHWVLVESRPTYENRGKERWEFQRML